MGLTEPKMQLKPGLGNDLESQVALCNLGQKSVIFFGWNHDRGGRLQPRPSIALLPDGQEN